MKGSWSRFTTGFFYAGKLNQFDLSSSAYYQFGRTSSGQDLSAYLLSASALYNAQKFSFGPGIDYTSGGNKNTVSKAFDPLYGTPHKFWGLMDYFYAGSPFGKGGLTDYYFKMKWRSSKKLSFAADAHHFASAQPVADENGKLKKTLGQEIDIVAMYNVTKLIGLEGGYGHFFSTALLSSPAVKNIPGARRSANWAYIMINIKTEFLFK